MKIGSTLEDLTKRVLGQQQIKRDFIAHTTRLALTVDDKTNRPQLRMHDHKANGDRLFAATPICMGQLGERVGIPRKYMDRLVGEAPRLAALNVNHWLWKTPEKRMVRTFDDGNAPVARAFLSERFRPLDNYDLCQAVLPKLEKAGCVIDSCEMTETRLYIQAHTPKLEALIKQRKAEGTGHKVGETNDVVQAGLTVSNSEVGMGRILVEPMIYRLVCRNGLILPTALARHHVGRSQYQELDQAVELFSDATRRIDDRAFWMKVCDVVDGALNRIKFEEAVGRINHTAGVNIGDPTEAVQEITKDYGLSDDEGKNVLKHLAAGGSLSQWGLVNAVTRTAEDCEDYDRNIALQRMGGEILELPPTNWSAN